VQHGIVAPPGSQFATEYCCLVVFDGYLVVQSLQVAHQGHMSQLLQLLPVHQLQLLLVHQLQLLLLWLLLLLLF
jgi:hypothetical protein